MHRSTKVQLGKDWCVSKFHFVSSHHQLWDFIWTTFCVNFFLVKRLFEGHKLRLWYTFSHIHGPKHPFYYLKLTSHASNMRIINGFWQRMLCVDVLRLFTYNKMQGVNKNLCKQDIKIIRDAIWTLFRYLFTVAHLGPMQCMRVWVITINNVSSEEICIEKAVRKYLWDLFFRFCQLLFMGALSRNGVCKN